MRATSGCAWQLSMIELRRFFGATVLYVIRGGIQREVIGHFVFLIKSLETICWLVSDFSHSLARTFVIA